MSAERMQSAHPRGTSIREFLLVLVGLSLPLWAVGAIWRVQIFSGFYLFQLPLAMPSVAAMIVVARRQGINGIGTLLGRTADFARLKRKTWYLPILLMCPSIGLINYCALRRLGAPVPALSFSLSALLAYSPVFLMAFTEEIGLTGYVTDRMENRHTWVMTGVIVGMIWAAYHIPGFVISGYYNAEWIIWHAIYIIALRVLFVWIYDNSGRSLFSMALCHGTFGLFWILLPATGNLQKANPTYDPRISALIAITYACIAASFWPPKTQANFQ